MTQRHSVPSLVFLASFASVVAVTTPTRASTRPEDPPAWDVNAPPGPTADVPIDVDEGTWMNVDLSPDGKTIVFDLLGDLYTIPASGGEAHALTHDVAWQMQPRFSPDGTRIAFTSDAGGGDNVWVMDASGSNARPVTKEAFRLLNSPCWSPDGAYVAARKHFTSHRSLGAGEIWLYHAAAGGEGLQLTTRRNEQKDLGEPVFSPDGRYVYFSHDATPGDSFEYNKDSNGQIYVIDRLDRTTGERETIASGPGGAVRPTPSHDGRKLAFVRRVRFVTTLFVQDLASGVARAVYDGLERDMQETWAVHGVYPTMAWTPDDEAIVLYARGKIRRVDVATGADTVIPFRVRSTRRVEEAVRVPIEVAPAEFAVKALRDVRVAPTGDRVAYVALGHVWVRTLPDGTPRRVTRDEDHFEFMPAWSRDGRALAFVAWNDDELGSVRVLTEGDAAPRVVTREPGHYFDPAFTPDGNRIVYVKGTGGYLVSPAWSREPGVYAVDVSGGTPFRLARSGEKPRFGAESDRVYLQSSESEKEVDVRRLWSVGLDGREERTHVTSENAVDFALSPDGKWIAWQERFQVFVAPFVATGRAVALGPKTTSIPIARTSVDAGENLQFSGDSRRLNWSLGPRLFEAGLEETFAFLRDPSAKPGTHAAPGAGSSGRPAKPDEGRDVSFRARTAVPEGRVAFVGARLVTMRGDEVIEDGAIVVDGNRITAVGPRAQIAIPAGALVLDAAGTTIVPGFVDVHAHGAQSADGVTPQRNWIHAANLAYGVTTIHDPSNDTNAIFAVSELARAGMVTSPRTFSTGTILYGAAGSFKAEVETLEDAVSHLRRLQAVGAFSVKSYNQPRREQRQMVIEAARRLGMMVVPEGGSLLQHNLTMVVDGHTGVEHSLPVERVYRDVTQLWAGSKTGYTPTLIVGYGGLDGEHYWYQHMDAWAEPRMNAFVPRSVLDPRSRRRGMAPDEDYNVLRSAGIVKSLVDSGSHAQLGAHGQLAGLGAHWELWLLRQSGITNLQALRCATLDGARYLGLDRDLGSLEPGKLADFMVLEKDPLADIRNSDDLRWTVLNGRVLDSNTLAPVDGRGGTAPHFWFGDAALAQPSPRGEAHCSGCGR